MKKNLNHASPAKCELLATTMVAALAFSPVVLGSGALAQTANQSANQPAEGGTIPLPTVEVERNAPGPGGAGGYGGAGPAQDPYNTSYVLPNASTGTKTDTPIRDTPLNVQAVSQQVLKDQQAITLQQALQNVSGVSVAPGISSNNTGFRSTGIYVRGFLEDVYYRDGFRVDATTIGFDPISSTQLANIADVQVLKGPGAVLYGLVEPGGIVNIVTKEPLDAPYFAVQQQIGSLALYRTSVDATGPLTDDKTWLYRMNMSYENNGAPFGSFIDLQHSQNIFFAPVVKWNIDPSTWVKLEAQYNYDRSPIYFAFDPVFNGAFVNIPRSRNYGEGSPNLQTSLFTALTWSHQFDSDWSIRQQLAYNAVQLFPHEVAPFPVVPPMGSRSDFVVSRLLEPFQITQPTVSTNVDITGHINTFGAEHTLLLGGDIYSTHGDENFLFFGVPSLIDLFNPIHPSTPFSCPCFSLATKFAQETAGLYAQDQINLPYSFYLLAGARYQYIRQTAASGASTGSEMPRGTPLVGQAVTPRFGLLWRPQDWVSLYGNYTQGFGPNSGQVFMAGLAPPTNSESWEAGAKLEFFNGKLRVSADYYELVKTNVPFGDVLHPGFVLLTGAARSTGPELDIQGEILPGWSVIANYTNDDVRITQGTGPGGGGLQTASLMPGQRFPGVPRNQANFWTTYEFQDEALKGWKIGAGYHYFGSQPVFVSGISNPGSFPLLPSYGTVDLMAAYKFKLAGADVTAQLNITNLLDQTYYTAADASLGGTGLFKSGFRTYGAPFAALGSLRAEF